MEERESFILFVKVKHISLDDMNFNTIYNWFSYLPPEHLSEVSQCNHHKN